MEPCYCTFPLVKLFERLELLKEHCRLTKANYNNAAVMYLHCLNLARLNNSPGIDLSIRALEEGLGWSNGRIGVARDILHQLGFIEMEKRTRGKNGQFGSRHYKINF